MLSRSCGEDYLALPCLVVEYKHKGASTDIYQESSRLAFAKRGRSMQASDLTDEVEVAFRNLFEDNAGSDAKL